MLQKVPASEDFESATSTVSHDLIAVKSAKKSFVCYDDEVSSLSKEADARPAIDSIAYKQPRISRQKLTKQRKADPSELTLMEFSLIKLLSEGVFQKNMSEMPKRQKIKPNSLSSIEKTLNYLKENFSAKSNEHLIAICKDRGII